MHAPSDLAAADAPAASSARAEPFGRELPEVAVRRAGHNRLRGDVALDPLEPNVLGEPRLDLGEQVDEHLLVERFVFAAAVEGLDSAPGVTSVG